MINLLLSILGLTAAFTFYSPSALAQDAETSPSDQNFPIFNDCRINRAARRDAVEKVEEGKSYIESRNFDAAIQSFNESLEICPTLSLAHYQLGFTFVQQQRWDEAIAAYRDALQYYQSSDALERPKIHEKLGDALRRGQPEISGQAQQEYEQAIELYRQAGTAKDYKQLGDLLKRLQRWEEAIDAYSRVISLNPGFPSSSSTADAYHNIGSIRSEQAQQSSNPMLKSAWLEEALEAFTAAIEEWQKLYEDFSQRGDYARSLANAYESRGNVRSRLNQPAELVQADYDAANQIQVGNMEECLTAEQCIELGQGLRRQGGLEAAIQNYTRAIELIQGTPNYDLSDNKRALLATAYNNRGVAYFELGDQDNQEQFDRAAEDYKKAIDIRREANLPPAPTHYLNLRRVLSVLAFYNREDNVQREELLRQSNEVFLTIKTSLEEATIKIIESIPGRVEDSELLFKLLFPQDSYSTYRDLAISLTNIQGYYDFYINALMAVHKREPSGNYQIEALEIAERAQARGFLEVLTSAGVYTTLGNRELAQQESEIRNQFQSLVGEWLDLSNKLPNRDLLSEATSTTGLTCQNSGSSSESSNDDSSTSARMATLLQQMRACVQEYETLWGQIGTQDTQFTQIARPASLNFKDSTVRKQLLGDRDTVLLEYWLGQEKSYLWVISSEGIQAHELPPQQEIEEAAVEFRKYLTVPHQRAKPVATARRGKQLSQMILGCAAEQLIGKKQIVVVADGALQSIPFNALPVPIRTSTCENPSLDSIRLDPDNLPPPLVKDYDLVNVPSASTLRLIQERSSNGRRRFDADSVAIAVIADPVFSSTDPRIPDAVSKSNESMPLTGSAGQSYRRSYPRLFGTAREVERIQDIARSEGLEPKILTGFDANYANISSGLRGFNVLHFATHGFLDDRQPENSGLVLSQFNTQGQPQSESERFLSMKDVFQLDPYLDANLVVLSGCRTGIGVELDGEGLLGLTRGFIYAGANRMVVSLWSVDDAATAELMEEFYRQLLDKEVAPAKSLAQAQRQFLKRQDAWRNPYYWAAFSFYGEWQ